MNIELTPEQAQRILNALATRPYAEVADLIAAIQMQGQEQVSKELTNGTTKEEIK